MTAAFRQISFSAIAVFIATSGLENAEGAILTHAPGSSLVVVTAHQLHFRPDLQVNVPSDPQAMFFGGVYEANFAVKKTLSGPNVGSKATIQFAGSHLDHWRDVTLLMVVRRQSDGQLWGGQSWERVDGEVCLPPDAIRSWRLERTFASRPSRSDGTRCLKI